MARQSSAKASTPVRIWSGPLEILIYDNNFLKLNKNYSTKLLGNVIITLSGMFVFQLTSLLVALFLSKLNKFDVFGEYYFFVSTCSFFILFAKLGLDEKISFTFSNKNSWSNNNPFKNKLLVIYELHSSSSININFLPKYKNSMNQADDCILYLSQKILDKNKIKNIDLSLLKRFFNNKKIKFVNDRDSLFKIISKIKYKTFNRLFMSSGNFDGLNFDNIINEYK